MGQAFATSTSWMVDGFFGEVRWHDTPLATIRIHKAYVSGMGISPENMAFKSLVPWYSKYPPSFGILKILRHQRRVHQHAYRRWLCTLRCDGACFVCSTYSWFLVWSKAEFDLQSPFAAMIASMNLAIFCPPYQWNVFHVQCRFPYHWFSPTEPYCEPIGPVEPARHWSNVRNRKLFESQSTLRPS